MVCEGRGLDQYGLLRAPESAGFCAEDVVSNQRVTCAPPVLENEKDDFPLRKTHGRRLQSRPVLPSIVSQSVGWSAASPDETSRTHDSDSIDALDRGTFLCAAYCERSHDPKENEHKAAWTKTAVESDVSPVARIPFETE